MDNITIVRRLFIVPLANDLHGKSSLLRALVNQGERQEYKKPNMGVRELQTPWGGKVDALVFIRSFQETLKNKYKSVEDALNGVDSDWRTRELVILPSHIDDVTCGLIIKLAHEAGFDVIVVPVIRKKSELKSLADCLKLCWDERWTMVNLQTDSWEGQVKSLGVDLWGLDFTCIDTPLTKN